MKFVPALVFSLKPNTTDFRSESSIVHFKLEGYEPTVRLSSGRVKSAIELRIGDNGMGISNMNTDKIFQPFFKTKPAGEGNGLGLSLSYDIITKGRGRELKVDTVEGQVTTFTVILPA